MTNREFICDQLKAFSPSEADLATLTGVNLDSELNVSVAERAMIPLIGVLATKPYQKSINENGFSVSWDMGNLGWWYNYLCSKYGIKPDANVSAALGLSVIKDATSKW